MRPRHAIDQIRRVASSRDDLEWLKPTGDQWLLDLDKLSAQFPELLANEDWAKGVHVIAPDVYDGEGFEDQHVTIVEFCVTEEQARNETAAPPSQQMAGAGENAMKESDSNRALIIHGHDDRNLFALKDLLQSKLRLPEPVVMAQQMVPGASLPEKFERLAARVGFAVALLTPDDVGALAGADLRPRARQNVLVEIGWFWGRLGRDRILLLVKEQVEWPSDLEGVEFYRFRNGVEEVSEKVRDFFEAHRSAKE
jgi:predicted nucleotide-binding protein